jgi:TonB family protein
LKINEYFGGMKNQLLVFTLLFFCGFSTSQEISTQYLREIYSNKESSSQRAIYKKTTLLYPENITVVEISHIEFNEIVLTESFENEEPIGIWVNHRFSYKTIDYDFNVIYVDSVSCVNEIDTLGLRNYFSDHEGLNYEAPKISTGEKNLSQYILRNVHYSRKAKLEKMEGKVHLFFRITKEGKVDSIVVLKGVNSFLDKEAVRLIRELKFLNPPMLDSQAVEMCVYLPIMFHVK